MKTQYLSPVICCAFFTECVAHIFSSKTKIKTTPELIQTAGYPVEDHQITTQDGYILTLHRIPRSPHFKPPEDGQTLPVAFLQHGLAASSIDWVAYGPSNALAYLLSDKGFDVWLGNSRGNKYSSEHISKDPKKSPYWDFSWHELGVYDLPAVFDYITNATGVQQFHYVGYSQGTTQFIIYCGKDPLCGSKIKSAHLLSPVVFFKYPSGLLGKTLSLIAGGPNTLLNILASLNVIPNTVILQRLCKENVVVRKLCSQVIKIFTQHSYINETMKPRLSEFYPDGASLKQFQHYLQSYNAKNFREFDYGKLKNIEVYGSIYPPEYNLNCVSTLIYLYYSKNDLFVSIKDVEYLISRLPEGIVRGAYLVEHPKWNHLDFVYGKYIKENLYDEVLKNILQDESNSDQKFC